MSKAIKVCIDPGHGMGNRKSGVFDPGACAGGIREVDIALEWALTLKHYLHHAGFEVFLTRDDSTDKAPVGLRDDKATAAGCTHFISLHCNAGGGTGVETFYGSATDTPLARMVQNAIVGATGGKNRGIKSASQTQHGGLAIMKFGGPCCLCELGFIDNAKDRVWLQDKDTRIKFAKAVSAGFVSLRGH